MKRFLRPAFVLLGLNVAGFLVFTLPRTLQERSLASQLVALRAEAERERGQVAALKRRAEAIRSNQKDAARFVSDVMKSRQATLLPAIAELHDAASAEGLEVGSETYGRRDVRDADLVRLSVTLPVKGSYAQLVGFLGRVERSKAFVVVETLALQEDDAGASLDVVVSVFFKADKEPAGA
jgi:hypothetical protein